MRGKVFAILALLVATAPASWAGTLEDIRARGQLQCGVRDGAPGFSEQAAPGEWVGFSVDFCRALAVAVTGKPSGVTFAAVAEDEQFLALQAAEIDVLVVPDRWSFASDIGQDVMFVTPLYRDAGSGAIIGPIVRQGDDGWFTLVRWTAFALIAAEELDITRDNVEAVRKSAGDVAARLLQPGSAFGSGGLGLAPDWVASVIAAVGNYREIFERNLGTGSPRQIPRGANQLTRDGGLMFSPPW